MAIVLDSRTPRTPPFTIRLLIEKVATEKTKEAATLTTKHCYTHIQIDTFRFKKQPRTPQDQQKHEEVIKSNQTYFQVLQHELKRPTSQKKVCRLRQEKKSD